MSYYLPIHFMALNAIPKKIIGGSNEFLSFLVGSCEKIADKLVNFSINMCMKLQASAVSRFC